MKLLGLTVFLAGMVMFASGLLFMDLASLPMKNDLYALGVLGFFNNMFSLNPSVATVQTVLSGLFTLMGCCICFAGVVMMRLKKVETEEERINRELWEGGYPPYNDKNLRYHMPNYERVGKSRLFGHFIAFPTQMARITYNKMVKLGIVNKSSKLWRN
tara:strand:+ start:53 stop:526 length:474 start_codon:yes stop_codon:yes gene_type:complete